MRRITTAGLASMAEIERVFAARLQCLDAKDWDHYGDFHTHDVVSATWTDLPGGAAPGTSSPEVVGRDNLTAAARRALDGPRLITTVHHGHNPVIELLSDTTARGTWAMEDRLWWAEDGQHEWLHGFGHYHEEYRREDGRWLISRRTLTRIRVDATPGFFR